MLQCTAFCLQICEAFCLFNLQARHMKKPGREGKIAVCVGTVTDDVRIYKLPKLKVSMLHT